VFLGRQECISLHHKSAPKTKLLQFLVFVILVEAPQYKISHLCRVMMTWHCKISLFLSWLRVSRPAACFDSVRFNKSTRRRTRRGVARTAGPNPSPPPRAPTQRSPPPTPRGATGSQSAPMRPPPGAGRATRARSRLSGSVNLKELPSAKRVRCLMVDCTEVCRYRWLMCQDDLMTSESDLLFY